MIGSFDLTAGSGSVELLNHISPNLRDSAPPSTTTLLYWYETDSGITTDPPYGNSRVKGCIIRDLEQTCAPFALSLNGSGATRVGPWQSPFTHQPAGDYLSGSFFYDPTDSSGQTHQFFAHWVEFPSDYIQAVHTNIVKVAP